MLAGAAPIRRLPKCVRARPQPRASCSSLARSLARSLALSLSLSLSLVTLGRSDFPTPSLRVLRRGSRVENALACQCTRLSGAQSKKRAATRARGRSKNGNNQDSCRLQCSAAAPSGRAGLRGELVFYIAPRRWRRSSWRSWIKCWRSESRTRGRPMVMVNNEQRARLYSLPLAC